MRWIWIVLLATTAHADPKPGRYVARYADGESLHITHPPGAINRQAEIRVTIDLLAANKLKVVGIGTRSEHNLYPTFQTDDGATWTTSWRGRWTANGDTLTLELELADHSCKHVKTESGTPPKTLPCRPIDKRATLTCNPEQIAIDDPKPVTVAVWRCTSTDALGETDTDWVIGKTTCVQRTGGRHGDHFATCAP